MFLPLPGDDLPPRAAGWWLRQTQEIVEQEGRGACCLGTAAKPRTLYCCGQRCWEVGDLCLCGKDLVLTQRPKAVTLDRAVGFKGQAEMGRGLGKESTFISSSPSLLLPFHLFPPPPLLPLPPPLPPLLPPSSSLPPPLLLPPPLPPALPPLPPPPRPPLPPLPPLLRL